GEGVLREHAQHDGVRRAAGWRDGGRRHRIDGSVSPDMAIALPTAPALTIRAVVKSFGGRRILDGADLELGPRARAGLIGANGSGKSTLLRMLAGDEAPDAGTVTLRRGARVAHLPQLVEGSPTTVRATLHAARPERAAVDAELERVEGQLADPALAADLRRMSRLL